MAKLNLKKIGNAVAAIEKLAAVDFETYRKLHPKTRKKPSDPMFKGMGAGPAKPAPKSREPKLEDAHKKEINKFVADKLKSYGYKNEAKKIESGKLSPEGASKLLEHHNFHTLSALMGHNPYHDNKTLMHTENRHDEIDSRGEGQSKMDSEHYTNERNHMLDAGYEAQNPEKRMGRDKLDSHDANRKLNALQYLHHHGLHDSQTAKRLHKQVEKNKDLFKGIHSGRQNQMKENIAREEEALKNFKPDPKFPDWKIEDQAKHLNKLYQARDKQNELGKKLGLE